MDLILFTNTPPQTKAHEREEAHERGLKFAKGLDHHPTNEGFACGSNCRGWIIIRRTIRRLRRMISISSSLHLVRWREVVGLLVVPIAGVGSSSDE
ncbi:hypothetical protein LINPERPRIM_LOCUS39492 [Linum perenne]